MASNVSLIKISLQGWGEHCGTVEKGAACDFSLPKHAEPYLCFRPSFLSMHTLEPAGDGLTLQDTRWEPGMELWLLAVPWLLQAIQD